MTPLEIRDLRANSTGLRERDFAEQNGLSEAALVAAYVRVNSTRINAHPDQIMGAAQQLGEVMAITRVPACVIDGATQAAEGGAANPRAGRRNEGQRPTREHRSGAAGASAASLAQARQREARETRLRARWGSRSAALHAPT